MENPPLIDCWGGCVSLRSHTMSHFLFAEQHIPRLVGQASQLDFVQPMQHDAPELLGFSGTSYGACSACTHSWWLCKPRNLPGDHLSGAFSSVVEAGMLRSDRTLTEKMFLAGVVPVLCCTARRPCGDAVVLCHTSRPVCDCLFQHVSTFHDCYIHI